jgi:hypothetical protein
MWAQHEVKLPAEPELGKHISVPQKAEMGVCMSSPGQLDKCAKPTERDRPHSPHSFFPDIPNPAMLRQPHSPLRASDVVRVIENGRRADRKTAHRLKLHGK